MRVHEVRSIEIEAPYDHAFQFIADAQTLPRWAHAFERIEDGRAWLRTPNGTAEIALAVHSSQEHGTVDWEMTFADGSVATAMSRLTAGARGRVIYTFVLNAPPVPLEQIEGALTQQAQTLETELQRLSEVVTQS
jgi:hypothetical protein